MTKLRLTRHNLSDRFVQLINIDDFSSIFCNYIAGYRERVVILSDFVVIYKARKEILILAVCVL